MRIIILLIMVIGCTSISEEEINERNKHFAENGCKDVPSNQRLICQSEMLKVFQTVLNDNGKIDKINILEQDAYCSRIKLDITYGNSLKEEWKIKRYHTFTICNTSFFARLKRDLKIIITSILIGALLGFGATNR